jgi:hypothetical protein
MSSEYDRYELFEILIHLWTSQTQVVNEMDIKYARQDIHFMSN